MPPSGEQYVARSWEGSRVPLVLGAIAALYLASLWLDAAGSTLPERVLPSFITYFTQAAALFPKAAEAVIDYRLEGWECAESRWVELDPRPDFPIDADTKESRFHRLLHFFRQNREVMQALEAYVIKRHNVRVRVGREAVGTIGGIRTQSLRLPIPATGQEISRFEHGALESYPVDAHHYWFWTPESRREERCRAAAPPDRNLSALRPRRP
jgi:hypothetical protein